MYCFYLCSERSIRKLQGADWKNPVIGMPGKLLELANI